MWYYYRPLEFFFTIQDLKGDYKNNYNLKVFFVQLLLESKHIPFILIYCASVYWLYVVSVLHYVRRSEVYFHRELMVCAILQITKEQAFVTVTKFLCNREDQILCRWWESAADIIAIGI